mgnify:CR=1 FL=1
MLLRRFGTLAELTRSDLGKAINYFRSLPEEKAIKEASDLGIYAGNLISSNGTTEYLEELINFSLQKLKSPIILPDSFQSTLSHFYFSSLKSHNMHDLNIGIHFWWHNFPRKPFPFIETLDTLMTEPKGNTKNKELWEILACQILYYAAPKDVNKNHLDFFFNNFLKAPYSLPAVAKLCNDISNPRKNKAIKESYIENIRALKNTYGGLSYSQKDYQLARDYMVTNSQAGVKLRMPNLILEMVIQCSEAYKDYDFIFNLFENFSTFSGGPKPDFIYSLIMKIVSQMEVEGKYIDAMEKIIELHKKDSVEREKFSNVLQKPQSLQAMINSYIQDDQIEEAILFAYDAWRLEFSVPEDSIEKLIDSLNEPKHYKAGLMLAKLCDSTSGSIILLKKLHKFRKQSGETDTEFVHEKHYTRSNKFLEPYLKSKDLETKPLETETAQEQEELA